MHRGVQHGEHLVCVESPTLGEHLVCVEHLIYGEHPTNGERSRHFGEHPPVGSTPFAPFKVAPTQTYPYKS